MKTTTMQATTTTKATKTTKATILGSTLRALLVSAALAAAALGPALAFTRTAAACGGYASSPEDRVMDTMAWHMYGLSEGKATDAVQVWEAQAVVTTIARDAKGHVKLTREASATALARWAAQGKGQTYTVHHVAVNGERAVVIAEISAGGATRVDELALHKDGGTWRIASATSRTL